MTANHFETPHRRLIALWVLRIFSSNIAHRLFIHNGSYSDPDIADFLDLPMHPSAAELDDTPRLMKEMLAELEAIDDFALQEPAASNLAVFTETLGFNETEAAILSFIVIRDNEPVLRDSLRVTKRMLIAKPELFLSRILKLDIVAVETALLRSGRLATSGVLQLHPNWGFFSSSVAANLYRSPCDSLRILEAMGVSRIEPPHLDLADYTHLEPELSLLQEYLRGAIARGKCGVNVLLHGDPGTGKTQLTRILAQQLDVPTFDFAIKDDEGDPKSPMARLTAIRIAGSFFERQTALFVFDEFEDIINPSGKDRGVASEHKGCFNKMLETNPHPVIWLSNSIHFLDPAFCRRFDFIIEVTVPPRSKREQILRHHVSGHISEPVIKRLADVEYLSPAVVSRVAAVMKETESAMPVDTRDDVFMRMVGSVLKAQGHKMPSLASDDILPPEVYDPNCLNTNADLPKLACMLREHPHARICLHGLPGTGKTAFGHWLSREIDMPLRLERASDLLSPFVGGTEMKIARAFGKAREENAILMIDEIDSFLQDRAKAVRSWEVTQVNELLTCLESYQGILIATTNRLENLDAASLRRFDLKLRFDCLNSSQIRDLLIRWCRSLGIASPEPQHLAMIESMEHVTPGDFAAAARRHRFSPFADAGGMIRSLREECTLKDPCAPRIGFL